MTYEELKSKQQEVLDRDFFSEDDFWELEQIETQLKKVCPHKHVVKVEFEGEIRKVSPDFYHCRDCELSSVVGDCFNLNDDIEIIKYL